MVHAASVVAALLLAGPAAAWDGEWNSEWNGKGNGGGNGRGKGHRGGRGKKPCPTTSDEGIMAAVTAPAYDESTTTTTVTSTVTSTSTVYLSHGDEGDAPDATGSPDSPGSPEAPEVTDASDSQPSTKEAESAPTPTSAPSVQSQPAAGESMYPGVGFQIIIHMPPVVPPASVPMDHPETAAVWDINLNHAFENATLVPALKAHGKTVICYFNSGAVQTYDYDFGVWPQDDSSMVGGDVEMGPAGDEFDNERWVNVANEDVVGLMQDRVREAKRLGCDGIDPDNVDAWTRDHGFGNTMETYSAYVRTLAETAHAEGLMIGLKNSPELVPELVDVVDFAVLEHCLEFGDEEEEFCGVYAPLVAMGKPVFDIEYPTDADMDDDHVNDEDYARVCEHDDTQRGTAGVSMIIKLDGATYGLNGWTQYCDGNGAFRYPTF